MASRPSFDPNKFAVRIKGKDWTELTSDPGKPLVDRAIQAQWAPGSTFKPIVALAGLESGSVDMDTDFQCGGGATFFGHYYKCWGTHGTVALHKGIVQSCDAYFYNVGNKTGIDNIAYYATQAGFGQKSGVDLPDEVSGTVPSLNEVAHHRQKWLRWAKPFRSRSSGCASHGNPHTACAGHRRVGRWAASGIRRICLSTPRRRKSRMNGRSIRKTSKTS